MKPTAQVVTSIENRLKDTWHLALSGDQTKWPHDFPLGKPSGSVLSGDFSGAQQWSFDWQDWTNARRLALRYASRRVDGTDQSLPSHVVIPDIDTAARVVGGEWPRRVERGRRRLATLRLLFPQHAQPWALIRSTDAYSDVDFDLLCTAAAWFREHPGSGLSPRQVPIEGLHSKWLNSHRRPVLDLAGVDDLGLVEVRPVPINFTYLDPDHRATGRRRHDSVSPGFWMEPEYQPQVVVITENKDTSVLFPDVVLGVSVQGHGSAGPSLISRVDWLAQAHEVIYWGDLDARGFEIVHEYRRFGVAVRTILMDRPTLLRFARFKAETDERGNRLKRSARKPLTLLTDSERAAYDMITDPSALYPIRVEQERIPVDEALSALVAVHHTVMP